MALDILPPLKEQKSYCARTGIEPARVASVGFCFVEAARGGDVAAAARLTSSPQAANAASCSCCCGGMGPCASHVVSGALRQTVSQRHISEATC
jgi:hypothetical protein